MKKKFSNFAFKRENPFDLFLRRLPKSVPGYGCQITRTQIPSLLLPLLQRGGGRLSSSIPRRTS